MELRLAEKRYFHNPITVSDGKTGKNDLKSIAASG